MEEHKDYQQPREQTPGTTDIYRLREGNKTPIIGDVYQSKPADIDDLYQSVTELYTPDTPTQGTTENYKSLPSWSFSPIPNTGIHLCQPRSMTPNDYSHNLTDISHYGNTEWTYPMYNWYYAANYMHSKSSVEADHVKPEPVTMPFYNIPPTSTHSIDRCSTPELISALANIPNEKQELKTTSSAEKASARHYYYSHSSSMCSSQNSSLMYLQMAGCYQDSGYNSDLNMSPVYPYQQQNSSHSTYQSKFADDINKVDSSDEENKENVAAVNSLRYEQFDRNEVTPELATSSVLNLANYSDDISAVERQIQSNDISSSDLAAKNLSKIVETTLKVPCKVQTSIGKRKMTETMTCAKRQRHNQPLNNDAIRVMMQWYETHQDSPYPNKAEKEQMAREGGISVTQVKSWFANKRNRNNNTRPKVQKRQMEERLLDICHQLARDAKNPSLNNADIIQQLSTIIAVPTDM